MWNWKNLLYPAILCVHIIEQSHLLAIPLYTGWWYGIFYAIPVSVFLFVFLKKCIDAAKSA